MFTPIFLFPLGAAALSTSVLPSSLLEKRHASQSAEDDEFRKFCASLIHQPGTPPSEPIDVITVGAQKQKLTFTRSDNELSLALVNDVGWGGGDSRVLIKLQEKVREEDNFLHA